MIVYDKSGKIWPQDFTFFILEPAEHEICPALKC